MSYDFTGFVNRYTKDIPEKIMIEATFKLSREDILNALLNEVVYVDGHYYKVPEQEFLYLVMYKKYKEEITLKLERIES